jgi:hypothetical protein
MRFPLRGRALQVALNFGNEHVITNLEDLGFTPDRAADVAAAAKKYADEETALLVRQLIPKSAWSGVVVVRRHFVTPREETWLMLKYESGNGWNLDSALFV